MQDNWIEIVDYYRQLGGSHVAVFIYVDKIKYRILGQLGIIELLL
nr:portal protein [Staphylococcus phage S-CoN_Ph38]